MPRKTEKADATDVEVKEAAPKKAPAKRAAKPKSEPKPGPVEEVVIQFADAEWSVADLKETAIAAYVAENHRRGSISKLALYVKPEERMVYYVVNDKVAGSVSVG